VRLGWNGIGIEIGIESVELQRRDEGSRRRDRIGKVSLRVVENTRGRTTRREWVEEEEKGEKGFLFARSTDLGKPSE